MNKPDGGPAFPMGYHRDGNSADHPGMTLRDYFAAKAMQGFLAGPAIAKIEDVRGSLAADIAVARICYAQADAMLAERDK